MGIGDWGKKLFRKRVDGEQPEKPKLTPEQLNELLDQLTSVAALGQGAIRAQAELYLEKTAEPIVELVRQTAFLAFGTAVEKRGNQPDAHNKMRAEFRRHLEKGLREKFAVETTPAVEPVIEQPSSLETTPAEEKSAVTPEQVEQIIVKAKEVVDQEHEIFQKEEPALPTGETAEEKEIVAETEQKLNKMNQEEETLAADVKDTIDEQGRELKKLSDLSDLFEEPFEPARSEKTADELISEPPPRPLEFQPEAEGAGQSKSQREHFKPTKSLGGLEGLAALKEQMEQEEGGAQMSGEAEGKPGDKKEVVEVESDLAARIAQARSKNELRQALCESADTDGMIEIAGERHSLKELELTITLAIHSPGGVWGEVPKALGLADKVKEFAIRRYRASGSTGTNDPLLQEWLAEETIAPRPVSEEQEEGAMQPAVGEQLTEDRLEAASDFATVQAKSVEGKTAFPAEEKLEHPPLSLELAQKLERFKIVIEQLQQIPSEGMEDDIAERWRFILLEEGAAVKVADRLKADNSVLAELREMRSDDALITDFPHSYWDPKYEGDYVNGEKLKVPLSSFLYELRNLSRELAAAPEAAQSLADLRGVYSQALTAIIESQITYLEKRVSFFQALQSDLARAGQPAVETEAVVEEKQAVQIEQSSGGQQDAKLSPELQAKVERFNALLGELQSFTVTAAYMKSDIESSYGFVWKRDPGVGRNAALDRMERDDWALKRLRSGEIDFKKIDDPFDPPIGQSTLIPLVDEFELLYKELAAPAGQLIEDTRSAVHQVREKIQQMQISYLQDRSAVMQAYLIARASGVGGDGEIKWEPPVATEVDKTEPPPLSPESEPIDQKVSELLAGLPIHDLVSAYVEQVRLQKEYNASGWGDAAIGNRRDEAADKYLKQKSIVVEMLKSPFLTPLEIDLLIIENLEKSTLPPDRIEQPLRERLEKEKLKPIDQKVSELLAGLPIHDLVSAYVQQEGSPEESQASGDDVHAIGYRASAVDRFLSKMDEILLILRYTLLASGMKENDAYNAVRGVIYENLRKATPLPDDIEQQIREQLRVLVMEKLGGEPLAVSEKVEVKADLPTALEGEPLKTEILSAAPVNAQEEPVAEQPSLSPELQAKVERFSVLLGALQSFAVSAEGIKKYIQSQVELFRGADASEREKSLRIRIASDQRYLVDWQPSDVDFSLRHFPFNQFIDQSTLESLAKEFQQLYQELAATVPAGQLTEDTQSAFKQVREKIQQLQISFLQDRLAAMEALKAELAGGKQGAPETGGGAGAGGVEPKPADEEIKEKSPAKERKSLLTEVDVRTKIRRGFQSDFGISEQDMAKVEGFNSLSVGQQALVLENLRQITLQGVQAKGVEQYRQDVTSSKFLGKVWKGIFKKYYQTKARQAEAGKAMAGGLGEHGKLLEELVRGLQSFGPEVAISDQGNIQVLYASRKQLGLTEAGEAGSALDQAIADFNTAAEDFSHLPLDWAAPAGDKARNLKDVRAVARSFEQGKQKLLKELTADLGDEAQAAALVADLEAKVQTDRFFNANPDVEQQLLKTRSQGATKYAILNIGTERLGYMAAGFAGRTAVVPLLGFMGLPLVAAASGAIMARRRAFETLREEELLVRAGKKQPASAKRPGAAGGKGVKAKQAEARRFIDASGQAEKLQKLFGLLSSADERKAKFRGHYRDALAATVEYVHENLERGLVSFGSGAESAASRYALLQALAQAEVALQAERREVKAKLLERVNEVVGQREETGSKKQRKYVNRQTWRGAFIAAGFASAGMLIREWVGFGPRPVAEPEPVKIELPTGKTPPPETPEVKGKAVQPTEQIPGAQPKAVVSPKIEPKVETPPQAGAEVKPVPSEQAPTSTSPKPVAPPPVEPQPKAVPEPKIEPKGQAATVNAPVEEMEIRIEGSTDTLGEALDKVLHNAPHEVRQNFARHILGADADVNDENETEQVRKALHKVIVANLEKVTDERFKNLLHEGDRVALKQDGSFDVLKGESPYAPEPSAVSELQLRENWAYIQAKQRGLDPDKWKFGNEKDISSRTISGQVDGHAVTIDQQGHWSAEVDGQKVEGDLPAPVKGQTANPVEEIRQAIEQAGNPLLDNQWKVIHGENSPQSAAVDIARDLPSGAKPFTNGDLHMDVLENADQSGGYQSTPDYINLWDQQGDLVDFYQPDYRGGHGVAQELATAKAQFDAVDRHLGEITNSLSGVGKQLPASDRADLGRLVGVDLQDQAPLNSQQVQNLKLLEGVVGNHREYLKDETFRDFLREHFRALTADRAAKDFQLLKDLRTQGFKEIQVGAVDKMVETEGKFEVVTEQLPGSLQGQITGRAFASNLDSPLTGQPVKAEMGQVFNGKTLHDAAAAVANHFVVEQAMWKDVSELLGQDDAKAILNLEWGSDIEQRMNDQTSSFLGLFKGKGGEAYQYIEQQLQAAGVKPKDGETIGDLLSRAAGKGAHGGPGHSEVGVPGSAVPSEQAVAAAKVETTIAAAASAQPELKPAVPAEVAEPSPKATAIPEVKSAAPAVVTGKAEPLPAVESETSAPPVMAPKSPEVKPAASVEMSQPSPKEALAPEAPTPVAVQVDTFTATELVFGKQHVPVPEGVTLKSVGVGVIELQDQRIGTTYKLEGQLLRDGEQVLFEKNGITGKLDSNIQEEVQYQRQGYVTSEFHKELPSSVAAYHDLSVSRNSLSFNADLPNGEKISVQADYAVKDGSLQLDHPQVTKGDQQYDLPGGTPQEVIAQAQKAGQVETPPLAAEKVKAGEVFPAPESPLDWKAGVRIGDHLVKIGYGKNGAPETVNIDDKPLAEVSSKSVQAVLDSGKLPKGGAERTLLEKYRASLEALEKGKERNVTMATELPTAELTKVVQAGGHKVAFLYKSPGVVEGISIDDQGAAALDMNTVKSALDTINVPKDSSEYKKLAELYATLEKIQRQAARGK